MRQPFSLLTNEGRRTGNTPTPARRRHGFKVASSSPTKMTSRPMMMMEEEVSQAVMDPAQPEVEMEREPTPVHVPRGLKDGVGHENSIMTSSTAFILDDMSSDEEVEVDPEASDGQAPDEARKENQPTDLDIHDTDSILDDGAAMQEYSPLVGDASRAEEPSNVLDKHATDIFKGKSLDTHSPASTPLDGTLTDTQQAALVPLPPSPIKQSASTFVTFDSPAPSPTPSQSRETAKSAPAVQSAIKYTPLWRDPATAGSAAKAALPPTPNTSFLLPTTATSHPSNPFLPPNARACEGVEVCNDGEKEMPTELIVVDPASVPLPPSPEKSKLVYEYPADNSPTQHQVEAYREVIEDGLTHPHADATPAAGGVFGTASPSPSIAARNTLLVSRCRTSPAPESRVTQADQPALDAPPSPMKNPEAEAAFQAVSALAGSVTSDGSPRAHLDDEEITEAVDLATSLTLAVAEDGDEVAGSPCSRLGNDDIDIDNSSGIAVAPQEASEATPMQEAEEPCMVEQGEGECEAQFMNAVEEEATLSPCETAPAGSVASHQDDVTTAVICQEGGEEFQVDASMADIEKAGDTTEDTKAEELKHAAALKGETVQAAREEQSTSNMRDEEAAPAGTETPKQVALEEQAPDRPAYDERYDAAPGTPIKDAPAERAFSEIESAPEVSPCENAVHRQGEADDPEAMHQLAQPGEVGIVKASEAGLPNDSGAAAQAEDRPEGANFYEAKEVSKAKAEPLERTEQASLASMRTHTPLRATPSRPPVTETATAPSRAPTARRRMPARMPSNVAGADAENSAVLTMPMIETDTSLIEGAELEVELGRSTRRSDRKRTLARQESTDSLVTLQEATEEPPRKVRKGNGLKTEAQQLVDEGTGAARDAEPRRIKMPLSSSAIAGLATATDEPSVRDVGDSADSSQCTPVKAETPPPPKRHSRRIAIVSRLPQTKTGLRKARSTAPTANTATQNGRPKQTRVLEEESSEDRSSDDVVQAACASTAKPAQPVLQARPQRSARPTRSKAPTAASGNSAPKSPSRVVSPKKPNQKASSAFRPSGAPEKPVKQQVRTTVPLFSGGRVQESHLPSPGPRTAPRSPMRVLSRPPAAAAFSPVKTTGPPGSPRRVLAGPSGAGTGASMPRSPGRPPVSSFKLPAQTSEEIGENLPADLKQPFTGYSSDAIRKAATKVFGTSIPAKHAGTTGLAATSSDSAICSSSSASLGASPVKLAVASRLGQAASPGLLGMSLAPESLLLAPPEPSSSQEPSGSLAGPPHTQNKTSATVFEPSACRRGYSQPPHSGINLSRPGSPRRATSAQPHPSPRRAEAASPRRVIVDLAQHRRQGVPPSPSMPGLASMPILPLVAVPSKLPQSGRLPVSVASTGARPAAEAASSTATTKSPLEISLEASQRRSQRSARPTRPGAAKSASTASQGANSTTAIPVVPALSATQLSALTNKNTNMNKAHYNHHEVTTVYKDENRPPSPTSKIRKLTDEPGAVSTSSSSSATGKADKKALKRTADQAELAQDCLPITTASGRKPHFRAAGDDEIYQSPLKMQKAVSNSQRPDRGVKWDRALLRETDAVKTPRRARVREADLLRKKACRVSRMLDDYGNVPESKASLSPLHPRQRVSISKIIYRDDPQE